MDFISYVYTYKFGIFIAKISNVMVGGKTKSKNAKNQFL